MAENQPMPVKKEGAPPAEIMRRPLLNLRDEIDRVFDDFMSWSPFRGTMLESPLERLGLRRGAAPAADVVEKDDAYEITVDVPGLAKDNIEIAMSDNTLTVRCNMEEETEEKAGEYYLCERRHETCSRAFALPPGVEADNIQADLKDGVLKIMLPKSAEAQQKRKRIEVRTH
ncbi:MAG: Hsp20/alpha crystallin family protein [Magnetospirillum sp.]|nr:MAG: Hsp20/alpha crystallin family protein [Magnetospirillum sp.]